MSGATYFSLFVSFCSIVLNIIILTDIYYREKMSRKASESLMALSETTGEYVDALENSLDNLEDRVRALEGKRW